MDPSEIKDEDVWKNEGYQEEYEFLKDLEVRAVTVEHVPVFCAYDRNMSTSFQLRHVVDRDGNRGFMCYVSKRLLCIIDTYRQGTTQEVYDEVKQTGEALQQEELRRSYLDLNRS